MRHIKYLRLWITLLSALSIMQGCLPYRQLNADGFRGWIVDENEKPVFKAKVINETLLRKGGKITRKTVTDLNGYFHLEPVLRWSFGWSGLAGPGVGMSLAMNKRQSSPTMPWDEAINAYYTIYVIADGFPEQKFAIAPFLHDGCSRWDERYVVAEKITLTNSVTSNKRDVVAQGEQE